MKTLPNPVVADLKLRLRNLARLNSSSYTNDLADTVDLARQLDAEVLIPALARAAGKGIRLWQAMAAVLFGLAGNSQVDQWISGALGDADAKRRSWAVQLVGTNRLHQFASLLNDVISADPDDDCRTYAVSSAGKLRSPINLPELLKCAADIPNAANNTNLLIALKKFDSSKARPYFLYVFHNHEEARSRVLAAWGLGRLGDTKAIQYLVKLLDDPDIRTDTSFEPGQAHRAAQALCDIYEWPFEWEHAAIERTRELWKARSRKLKM